MGLFDSVGRALGDAAREAGQVFAESLRQSEAQLERDDGAPEIHVDVQARPAGELKSLTCPQCDASIQAPAGTSACYCMYCGAQLYFDDGSTTVTYRTVDETRLREAEMKNALELKRIEIEEKRRPGRIRLSIVLGIFGALMLIGGYVSKDFLVIDIGLFALMAIAMIWLFASTSNGNDGRE